MIRKRFPDTSIERCRRDGNPISCLFRYSAESSNVLYQRCQSIRFVSSKVSDSAKDTGALSEGCECNHRRSELSRVGKVHVNSWDGGTVAPTHASVKSESRARNFRRRSELPQNPGNVGSDLRGLSGPPLDTDVSSRNECCCQEWCRVGEIWFDCDISSCDGAR